MRARWSLVAALLFAGAAQAAPANSPHVLMINGGGSPQENFSSHLAHLRQMLALAGHAGIPADHITVLNADGEDAAPDSSVHAPEPDGFAYLAGTPLGARLEVGPPLENSTLAGVHALPATRAALDRWFAGARTRLHAGDTLLLYVTDHGSQNERDPLDNKIVLWGKREAISVRQLRALLDRLAPGVQVVALMSQCFSGGFAHLSDSPGKNGAQACGYFSSTPDRPAYGCYPAVAGREGIGHSFEFMEALSRGGRFAQAHAETLVADDTPDVPLRSSDVYLADLVAHAARAAKQTDAALIDSLLREAWKNRAAWEPEIRLLDRIGQAFGLTSPRSLAEIETTRVQLDALLKKIQFHGDDWDEAHRLASEANQRRFFAEHREWEPKVTDRALRSLSDAKAAELALQLGPALRAAAQKADRAARMETLAARGDTANEAAYRVEVRLAALLRMRAVLAGVAGRVHLETRGTAAARASYDALRRCEDFALPLPAAKTAPPAPKPLPSLADELKTVDQVVPSWMGIQFDVRPPARLKIKVADGAAPVIRVLPNSPALAAGLMAGDLVLGPPGHPFTERAEIKIWTMLLPAGKPEKIEILRGEKRQLLTLTPGPRPVDLPKLGAPAPGSPAPLVSGTPFRGVAPAALLAKGPVLLLFWATWCGPCKESLPEAMAFSRARGVPILAITDEGRRELEPFFAHWKAPFPPNVVSNEDRSTFGNYGVSGTPTFVLIDEAHKVRSYSVGYNRARGLAIEGWRWDGAR